MHKKIKYTLFGLIPVFGILILLAFGNPQWKWCYVFQKKTFGVKPSKTFTGNWKDWSLVGSLRSITPYVNGQKDGKKITYFHHVDAVSDETDYYRGEKHGLDIGYHSNGEIRTKSNYINGLQEGEFFFFNEDGKGHRKYHYLHGVKHGLCLQWHFQTEKLEEKVNYKEGLRHGLSVKWDGESGDLLQIVGFDEGSRKIVIFDLEKDVDRRKEFKNMVDEFSKK